MARSSFGEDFLMSPYGAKIKSYYNDHIKPEFGKNFSHRECSDFRRLIELSICHESDRQLSSRIDQAKDTGNYIGTTDTPHDVLVNLERAIGPIRLVIIPLESGTICGHHHIGLTGAEDLRSDSPNIHTTQVEVFHKKKTYQYIIDRGSNEISSQFTREQRDTIIEPILRIYIERLEYAFFSAHADHGACIHQYEERENSNTTPRDYNGFIERVI
jgi:hypothetical protein